MAATDDGSPDPTAEIRSNVPVVETPSTPDVRRIEETRALTRSGPELGETAELEDEGAKFVATAERVPLFSWGSASVPSLPSIDSDDRYVRCSTYLVSKRTCALARYTMGGNGESADGGHRMTALSIQPLGAPG